jgi:hypothetical protein
LRRRRCFVTVSVDEVIGGAGAGVSMTTGAGGAGVSTITGAGGGGTSTTTGAGGGGASTITGAGAGVSMRAGLSVTDTVELAFFGIMLTSVFKPVAEPFPEPPVELLVYARPLLSTFAGPEMTAGVDVAAAPCVFAGAGASPIACAEVACCWDACSVRISPESCPVASLCVVHAPSASVNATVERPAAAFVKSVCAFISFNSFYLCHFFGYGTV